MNEDPSLWAMWLCFRQQQSIRKRMVHLKSSKKTQTCRYFRTQCWRAEETRGPVYRWRMNISRLFYVVWKWFRIHSTTLQVVTDSLTLVLEPVVRDKGHHSITTARDELESIRCVFRHVQRDLHSRRETVSTQMLVSYTSSLRSRVHWAMPTTLVNWGKTTFWGLWESCCRRRITEVKITV